MTKLRLLSISSFFSAITLMRDNGILEGDRDRVRTGFLRFFGYLLLDLILVTHVRSNQARVDIVWHVNILQIVLLIRQHFCNVTTAVMLQFAFGVYERAALAWQDADFVEIRLDGG